MGVYRTRGIKPDLEIARLDRGNMQHDLMTRPRPTPYDVTASLTPIADAVADTFGNYLQLVAQGAYDFGDTPNRLQVRQLVVEDISANDVFVLEFYAYDGDATYVPLGAIRIVRLDVFTRSFIVELPCRCFDIDANSLVVRLKSGAGGSNILVSLGVTRMVHTDYMVPNSPGVWPTG